MNRLIKRRISSAVAAAEAYPSSVFSIPTKGPDVGDAGAAIRGIGCSRRVFLLKPHLTSEEIDGLAYRIKMLSKNTGLNSVFIATSNDDDVANGAMPASILEFEKEPSIIDMGDSHSQNEMYHVSGGYDPITVYESGTHDDPATLQELLSGVSDLALAIYGGSPDSRIPVVTVPHGLLNDSGYAFCMGSYVVATPDTSFRILNPSRGLSFDPIGLSYSLPRLGWEFHQPSAEYSGCGMILALTGMEADASDMMETGLATHYMDSVSTLGMLERSISELPPWDQQGLTKKPPRFYGQKESGEDTNARFRNNSVAHLLFSFSNYTITSGDMFTSRESDFTRGEDPTTDLDNIPWHQDRMSDLVNYAATFDPIFKEEKSVTGILERFREVASRNTMDEEEQAATDAAKDIVSRMEQQSPLSLAIIHRLMEMGSQSGETLDGCMEREAKVQAKLFAMDDFKRWAEHTKSGGSSDTFQGWKHKDVKDVSVDEVDELLS